MDIADILAPKDIWDIFVYVIFFLSLITMFLIPEKNPQPQLLITIVLILAAVDKLRRIGNLPIPGLGNQGFATMLIHVAMFALPMMTAGLLRIRGRQGRQARPLSILIGLIAGTYSLLFFINFNGIGI